MTHKANAHKPLPTGAYAHGSGAVVPALRRRRRKVRESPGPGWADGWAPLPQRWRPLRYRAHTDQGSEPAAISRNERSPMNTSSITPRPPFTRTRAYVTTLVCPRRFKRP